MKITEKFKVFTFLSLSYGLSHSNHTNGIAKQVMEITLPTKVTPKRPVLPDNWGEDRSGKVKKSEYHL